MKDYIDKLFSPRKAEIVKAVLKLADQVGIGHITTKRIALEVGFAEGALYRHVRGKEDLFDLIIEMVSGMIKEKAAELDQLPGEEQQLRDFFNFALSFLEQYPGIYHIIFSDAHYNQDEKIFERFKALIFDIQHHVSRIVSQGKEKGLFARQFDSDMLALNYLGTIHTVFTLWNVFRKRDQSLLEIAIPFFDQYLFLLKPELKP